MREDICYKVLKISCKVTIFKIVFCPFGFPDASAVRSLSAKLETQEMWVLAVGQKTIL